MTAAFGEGCRGGANVVKDRFAVQRSSAYMSFAQRHGAVGELWFARGQLSDLGGQRASRSDLSAGATHTRLKTLGVDIDVVRGKAALECICTAAHDTPRHIAYVNAHSLNLAYSSPEFRAVLNRADLVLNDGIGLAIAAQMRGVRFPENLNGSDFTVRVLAEIADRGWGVFLYGGLPGVAEAAGRRLQRRLPHLSVVGSCDGHRAAPDDVARLIKESGADAVLVALGQPRQELWIDRHLRATGCAVAIGVGAFLDFSAGRVPRAPAWMNRSGLEWSYRLVQEPRRLWRRYIIGMPLFLWRAWQLSDVEFAQPL